jgi:hypothetical protein
MFKIVIDVERLQRNAEDLRKDLLKLKEVNDSIINTLLDCVAMVQGLDVPISWRKDGDDV